jgi:uncharacterized integral membrane protein
MARRTEHHDPMQVKRTRTSSAWVTILIALVFLILLIDFIAQNNRQVPLYFLGASGHVSEALALLVAAVAGAVLVVLIGTARILQLRLATRRHNRAARQQAAAAPADSSGSVPPAAPQRETQSVQAQHKP